MFLATSQVSFYNDLNLEVKNTKLYVGEPVF